MDAFYDKLRAMWARALAAGGILLGICGLRPGAAAGGDKRPEPDLTSRHDLMPGTKCKKATMPKWVVDTARNTASLPDAGYHVTLPKGYAARLERPDLVVVTAPSATEGLRPTFELFVSPICKSYDGPAVAGRIAARTLSEVSEPKTTATQVKNGRWSAGLGGPVGRSLILFDVAIATSQGARKLVLYVTDLGEAKSFGVHAAAACASPGAPGTSGPCEETYFAMLKSTEPEK
jgi:hypothetical protein